MANTSSKWPTTTFMGMKILTPRKMDAYHEMVEKELLKVVQQEARQVKREFQKTTRTWTGRPKFQWKITSSGRKFTKSFKVWTDHEIYFYVNFGTRIRWALMSRNFISKTRPRIVASRAGAGGAVLVGKRAFMQRHLAPRPGIEARRFDLEIKKQRQNLYKIKVDRAIRRGVLNGARASRRASGNS